MKVPIRVVSGDYQVRGDFGARSFSVLRDPWGVVEALAPTMEAQGVALRDTRVMANSQGSPTETNILWSLSPGNSFFRIFPDHVEYWSVDTWSAQGARSVHKGAEILTAVVGLAGACVPSIVRWNVSMGIHASLVDGTVGDLLAAYVKDVPAGLGPYAGGSVVFHFGPIDRRLFSSLSLDRSASVEGGLYLRLDGAWEANEVLPGELLAIFTDLLRNVASALNLELAPSDQGVTS